ncbi:MAG: hypothetical protein QOJ00_722 [Actinomycetota bacterium]
MKLANIRVTRSRGAMLLGAGGILAAAVGVLPAHAAAPVPFSSAAFSGSASGEAIHVDALMNSISAEVAHGSSAVNSKGITATAVDQPINQPINPALPSKNAYAFGKGLDVGPGVAIADQAESDAPPNKPAVQNEVAVPVNPLVYASLSRGHAATKYNTDTCVLGSDLANGYGYVADANVLETGTSDPNSPFQKPLVAADTGPNTRDVVQSVARQTIVPVPGVEGAFGLQSQVATTLVPITLFKGTPTELTIEVAGDWILTAVASGIPGKSTVAYRPADIPADKTLPVITVIQAGMPNRILTFESLLGGAGLPINIPGVADISIAEPATQSISADGTTVSASADVVRVVLADNSIGNIRVGHAAVKATAPAGGIACPIPVTKKATPNTVNTETAPDGKFQVAITIRNGFDCDLINVSAIDEITRKSGNIIFGIEENDPRNDPKKGAGATFTKNSPTSSTASYANLGTLAPGASKVINVVLSVGSGTGEIQDIATARGTLNCAEGSALGKATVNLSGSFTLVTVAGILARTGGTTTGLALMVGGTAMAAVITRRVSRTRRRAQA